MKYYLPEILKSALNRFGNDNYIYEKLHGSYVPHTFQEFYNDVLRVAADLQSTHRSDDIIVICSENSYEYMVADLAIMGFTGISATLSKEWSEHDLIEALKILQPKTFFYGQSNFSVIEKLRRKFPKISFISLTSLLKDCHSYKPELDWRRIEVTSPCKIVFTSGTTSTPKAVMLSQNNIFSCYDDLKRRAPLNHSDRDYLFLPLNHTYANIWNFLISLINGMEIYLCSDTKQIFAELAEVKPTVFCAVPLIYEKLYEICQTTNRKPQDLLGGNIKYLFCGGAYFRPEIRQFLKENHLNLLEAYGLTETSSMVSVEYPDSRDFTSSGILMESLFAKIDNPNKSGIGELMIKGDNIFREYYKNPEATRNAKAEDGFFRTGDLGKIMKLRSDGSDGVICYQTDDTAKYKLYLYGRKKRIILFSNGENIYPDDIEKLFDDPNITKVKVFQKNNQIFAQIFVKSPCDGKDYIDIVNQKLPKFSQIRGHEVIVDSYDVRLK